MFSLLISIFGAFIGLSTHGAISRVYFEKNIKFREYVFNVIVLLISTTIVIFSLSYYFGPWISNITSVPREWILMAVVASFFNFTLLIILSIYQAQKMSLKHSILSLSYAIINVFLSLVFVIYLGLEWQGRALGIVLSFIIIGIISLILLVHSWSSFKINVYYMKHALKFGIPLIPHSLGGMLIVYSDRVIINNLLGTGALGIYMVALQIGVIIEVIVYAFFKAYSVWVFENIGKLSYDEKKRVVKRIYIGFVLLLCSALTLYILFRLLHSYLIGKEYTSGVSSIILPILIGNSFGGMYYMVAVYIDYAYKTYMLAIITLIVGVANILITYILTKAFDLYGAAYAFCLVKLTYFLLTCFFSYKAYNMPWLDFWLKRRK